MMILMWSSVSSYLDWAAILALPPDGSHIALKDLHVKAFLEQAHRQHLPSVCVNGPNAHTPPQHAPNRRCRHRQRALWAFGCQTRATGKQQLADLLSKQRCTRCGARDGRLQAAAGALMSIVQLVGYVVSVYSAVARKRAQKWRVHTRSLAVCHAWTQNASKHPCLCTVHLDENATGLDAG